MQNDLIKTEYFKLYIISKTFILDKTMSTHIYESLIIYTNIKKYILYNLRFKIKRKIKRIGKISQFLAY